MAEIDLGKVRGNDGVGVTPSMAGIILNKGKIDISNTEFTGFTGVRKTFDVSMDEIITIVVTPMLSDADKGKISQVTISLEDITKADFAVRWKQEGRLGSKAYFNYIAIGR